MNAKLIVFEGIDGSGKTVQAERLEEFISDCGYYVELVCEKWGNDFIKCANILLSMNLDPVTRALIFNAIRVEHTKHILLPALNRNDFVVMDRRELSTFAYQGVLEGVDMQTLLNLNNANPIFIEPDCTFLIKVSSKTANKRLMNRGNTFAKWDEISSCCYNMFSDYPYLIEFHGEQSEKDVHYEVIKIFSEIFGRG